VGLVTLSSLASAALSLAPSAQIYPGALQPAHRFPVDLALGDVNGDGFDDFASLGDPPFAGQPGALHLFLGDGAGGKLPGAAYPVGTDNQALALADLDGDGFDDVVVASSAPVSQLFVFRGAASGALSALGPYSTAGAAPGSGQVPVALALVDVDADGTLDAVTANVGSADVSWLRGLGGGVLAAAQTTAVGAVTGAAPTDLAAADLDGDGLLDLALPLANPNHQVSLWLGSGTGSFAHSGYLSGALDITDIAAADLDGDGDPELCLASPYTFALEVYPDSGAGLGYGAPVSLAEPGAPWKLAVLDLDLDGHRDLVALNFDSSLTVFRGNGTAAVANGAFGRFATASEPVALTSGSLDGTARPDLAVAVRDTGGVGSLLSYLGAGTTLFPNARSYAVGQGPSSVAAGDFDSDGELDLVTSNWFSGDLSVLIHRGQGIFNASYSVPGNGLELGSVAVADIDFDGHLDLVAAETGSFAGFGTDVLLWLGLGNGTFQAPQSFAVGGAMPRNVTLADLDGDGLLDAVTANVATNDLSVLLGSASPAGFQAPTTWVVTSSAFSPYMVAVEDLDLDGIPDLVVAHNDSTIAHQTVIRGLGGGVFDTTNATAVPVGGFLPIWAALGDLTGDGVLDLASANSFAPGADVGVVPGNGSGGFLAPTTYVSKSQPFQIGLADFDGDGWLDWVTANTTPYDRLTLRLSNGAGGFVAPEVYGSGRRPQSLGLFDVNADGATDLVGVDFDSNSITVHRQ
jgi:hypothetical protein